MISYRRRKISELSSWVVLWAELFPLPPKSYGTPLQYSCLENPMDGGAWKAAVHGVSEGQTRLSDFTFAYSFSCIGEGNDNPLQCSCLENPRVEGAWWAAVYGVAQSQTRLTWRSSSSSSNTQYQEMRYCCKKYLKCEYWVECIFSSECFHFEGRVIYPVVELLDHKVAPFSVIWGTFTLFSIVADQFTFIFPTAVYEGPLFSTRSPTFVIYRLFDISRSDRCEVITHGFDLHFLNN